MKEKLHKACLNNLGRL